MLYIIILRLEKYKFENTKLSISIIILKNKILYELKLLCEMLFMVE